MSTTEENTSLFPKKIISIANKELTESSEDIYDTFVKAQLENEVQEFFNIALNKFHELDNARKESLVTQFITHKTKNVSILSELLEDLWGDVPGVIQSDIEIEEYKKATFNDQAILSPGQVADNFPKVGSINTIKKRVRTNKIIGYSNKGNMCIPAWQFYKGNILPGLDTVISHINKEGLEIVSAMETPMYDYDNKAAYQFLRDGDIKTAIEIVRLITGVDDG